jgi:hypothetical protein
MRTVSPTFRQLAAGHVRPLAWNTRISFDKTFNEDTTFFTLDVSELDGMDILAPNDDNPLQAWDKYAYADFDNRTISLEVTREETEPYSIVQAYADVTLNNYDSYYTPNSGSPIDTYILPRRPFRLSMGFGATALQQIVGLSDNMPKLDKTSRTASFHILDFMTLLLGKNIGETIILENVKTHEVLDYLLQYMGLSSDQYVLDGSINTIKFFYVEAGTTFGTVANKLMEAEIGKFYLDEQGTIRFKNRYNYDLTPVYTFDKSNTVDYSIVDQPKIINSVKVTAARREVQSLKSVGTGQTTSVPAGETVGVFVNFNDPVTYVNNPVYSATAITDSYFTSVLASDNTTAYTDVNLISLDQFSKSAKLTFENTGVSDASITAIDIYGTPAEVVENIEINEIDQDSIDKFEEQHYTIDNEYIQDKNSAQTRAIILLRDYKDYNSTVDIDVKGTPALQLSDAVTLDLDGFQGIYSIIKITNITSDAKFQQRMRVLKRTEVTFFTLDQSTLNGLELLSP